MIVNAEIQKTPGESNSSVVRRFTKKVQGLNLLRRVRSSRYKSRDSSKYTRKKMALKLLERRSEIKKLIKLGKLPDKMARE